MSNEIPCTDIMFKKANGNELKIEAVDRNLGGYISSQSVESLLLFEILKVIRSIYLDQD